MISKTNITSLLVAIAWCVCWQPTAYSDGRLVLRRVLLAHAHTDAFRVAVGDLSEEMISVNHRLSDGSTLLHLAARNGEDFIVEHLLQRGVNTNAVDATGRTGYTVAVKSRQVRSAALLLEHTHGVNALNQWGRSPINLATRDTGDDTNLSTGYLIATKLMLKGGDADLGTVEDDELKYLRSVGLLNDAKLQEALLTNNNIIPYFAADNDVENLERALRLGQPTEQVKNRALMIAASHSDMEAMNLLIAHGVDANIQDTGFGLTPLMVAINNGNRKTTRKLLDELRVNLDVQDHFGNTALHHACTRGDSTKVVSKLIAAGADPTIANKKGCVPLALSVMAGKSNSARIILTAMPDLKVLKKPLETMDGRIVPALIIVANAIDESAEFERVFADVADELEYLRGNALTRWLQRIFPRKDPDGKLPVSGK